MTSSLSMSRTEPPPAGRRGKLAIIPPLCCRAGIAASRPAGGRERAGGRPGVACGRPRGRRLGPDPDRGHIQHAGLAVGQDRAHRAVRRLQHRAAGRHVRAAGASGPREAEAGRRAGRRPRAGRTAPGCRRDRSCRPARSRAQQPSKPSSWRRASSQFQLQQRQPLHLHGLAAFRAQQPARAACSIGWPRTAAWIHVPGGTGCRSS